MEGESMCMQPKDEQASLELNLCTRHVCQTSDILITLPLNARMGVREVHVIYWHLCPGLV
jgi:hypothetical protein